MAKRGPKPKRPTKTVRIDRALYYYILQTHGNFNQTLLKAFPDSLHFQEHNQPTNPNQLKAFD